MLRRTLLPTFKGVTPDETAVCDMVLGRRYHVVGLRFSDDGTASNNLNPGNPAQLATILANFMSDIRVLLDEKPQRTHSGVQLNALNALNDQFGTYAVKTAGQPGTAGFRLYLPIYFAEVWRDNPAEVPTLAWNLNDASKGNPNGVNSAQIEVDVGTGTNATSIVGLHEWEPADPGAGVGLIGKWFRQNITMAGQDQDVPLIRKEFIQSLHFFPSVEAAPKYVNKVKLTANGVIINDDTLDTLDNQVTLLGRKLQPDTSATPRFDMIFDYDDPRNNALVAAPLQELTAKITMNAAANGNVPVITQRVGPPE